MEAEGPGTFTLRRDEASKLMVGGLASARGSVSLGVSFRDAVGLWKNLLFYT